MSGEASLQTLPNQREAAVHAASPSTEKPAWQEISSEQTAAEELAAPGQGGLADHASSKSPAAPEPSRPASLAAVATPTLVVWDGASHPAVLRGNGLLSECLMQPLLPQWRRPGIL